MSLLLWYFLKDFPERSLKHKELYVKIQLKKDNDT